LDWPNGFTSTSEDLSNLAPGSYNLQVIDNGTVLLCLTMLESQENLVFQGKTDISCYNLNDGRIALVVAGGNLPYIYNWTIAVRFLQILNKVTITESC
jgi:hypothetical protein